MLRFRGSDCRRSRGLTWYDRMDNLVMDLGFTESKAYSNLCFKVEGGIPVILLLYVDDSFLKEELIKVERRRFVAKVKMKDLDMMHYLLGKEVWQNALSGVLVSELRSIVEAVQAHTIPCKARSL